MDVRLTPADLGALAQLGQARSFRRGQRLFRESEEGGWVAAIRSGRVKIGLVTPSGRDLVLAVKERGDLVGELSALDGRTRSATATALDAVTAVVVPAEAFERFLEARPGLAVHLLRILAAQVRETSGRWRDNSSEDVPTRITRRLIALADRFQEHNGPGAAVVLDLTQDELAGWVGGSREAASRALAELRAAGVVKTGRGKLTIVDPPALRARL